MATKTTRRTAAPAQTPQTSTSNVAGSSERPSSPLSPTRLSRMQEKLQLQNLNDRLATYIDRVRYLEAENSKLTQQVQTTQETITREVTNIKSMYEQELSDARKLLDDTAKEKARLQIEAGKFKSENEELRLKLNKREKDLAVADKRLLTLETLNQDLQSRLNQAVADKKRMEDDLKEAQAENEKMAKQLATARTQLEEETLARVDLENRVQSLKEEMTFKESIHQRELTETRMVQQTEISEIDRGLKEEYEQKLSDTLKELREQYESQMRMNRDEIENLYENKLFDMQKLMEQNADTAHTAQEELRSFKSRVESMTSKIGDLESQNVALQSRVRDLERLLEQERNWHHTAMQAKEDELAKLRDKMERQLLEYQDLLDIKVALDLEIAAYRKLLEGEETRLHITPSPAADASLGPRRATPVRRTPMRGTKRKRTLVTRSEQKNSCDFNVTASARGTVQIHDHNPDEKFIKLHNKGSKEVALGSWQLIHKSDDRETIYKFHRSFILKPECYVTVWSADSNITHNPPSDLVMKGQTWLSGDKMTTTLLDASGEEMAVRETTKVLLSSLAQRMTDSGSYLEPHGQVGAEELYHHQGDPDNPQERCTIM